MKNELEQRAYSFDVKAEESERGKVITGRPIVYNSRTDLGLFNEVIEAGALDIVVSHRRSLFGKSRYF